ncbi:MAG: type II toxin-antitoxin system RelE/ParE family toxin [Pirellulaceae bacterium]|nr:type II toxin-antitoxin system RelE/ParE family toxin [Pirellulaceae bacterium]
MAKARKTKVFLTDRAIEDLQEIESYTIGKWGDAQAAKYLDAFDRCFSLVESEPGILLPIPIIDTLLTHTVESHVVVCTKWNDDVLVLTIVHARRDLLPHLDQLLPTLRSEVESLRKRLP